MTRREPLHRELTRDRAELREHERLRLGGSVRLIVDTTTGVATRVGQIADLSEGGCALRVYKPVSVNVSGRVELQIGATPLSLPVMVRWARDDSHSWKVGCLFDQLTDEKKAVVRGLLQRLSERSGPGLRCGPYTDA